MHSRRRESCVPVRELRIGARGRARRPRAIAGGTRTVTDTGAASAGFAIGPDRRPTAGRGVGAAGAGGRAVVVEAAVEVGSVRHSVEERTRTERYLAGVDRYENPEYPVRARDEMYSREQARAYEAP